MARDRSRRRETPHFGYTGVIAQQGRVVLDRDFNAQQAFSDIRDALDALTTVGRSGSPDNGFRISVPALASPPSSPPGASREVDIAAGLMYLGGRAVVLPAPCAYANQPDWPAPPPVANTAYEIVYLDVTELEIGAVEDPDLLEVALGGPDTTGRAKLLRRIRRRPVAEADCDAAWQEVLADWSAQGLNFDPLTMALTPRAGLQIGFLSSGSTGDPCDPVATGGYLGADNQLVRVRVVNSGAPPKLLWGYDNASFLYRVASVSTDKTLLKLTSDPPDAFHFPQAGQIVEILASAAFLGKEPDQTDPSGASQIIQAAAEATGFIAPLAQAYGPAINGDSNNYLTLPAGAWPSDFADHGLPLYVRVWQAAPDLPAGGGTVLLADGVTATISLPPGGVPPDGAFWEIALRPGTPQGCYPETLLTAPQPADGPRRWACPLALIDWTGASGDAILVEDCRPLFAPATGRLAPLRALYAPNSRLLPLPSGGSVRLDILARGLTVATPMALDASSVSSASVRLYADLPVTINQLIPGSSDGRMAGVQSIALASNVSMPTVNRIVVTPTQAARDLLSAALARRITTGTSSDFTSLFTTADFGPDAAHAVWAPQGDGSVAQTNPRAAFGPQGQYSPLTPSLALYNQAAASQLSHVGLSYHCGAAAGSAGVVFNWTSNADFWVFYNDLIWETIGWSGAIPWLSSSVQHIVNGQVAASFSAGSRLEPPGDSAGHLLGWSADLDISASKGGLNFQSTARFTNGVTANFPLQPNNSNAYPKGFVVGAR
ncbi:MAG TPA: DUF6519 domain-containing protein, partial [Rhodoblastus sp.]|nr:DUF6519 domain-containing protein [Rhodoblastus sp.]